MGISQKVIRKLWASSGGYCANPSCHKDLFPFFENGEVANIEEFAHIIGRKKKGPRGKDDLPMSQRDEFDNIIVLCPSCHTLVDKNEKQFPTLLLKEWKRNHENSIKGLFQEPRFKTRAEARAFIAPLFKENRYVFMTFGPNSDNAKTHQMETELEWRRLSIQKIIPNNRRIEKIIESNSGLLTKEERDLFISFKVHREGFEFNKLSGDVNAVVPRFPDGFDKVFE